MMIFLILLGLLSVAAVSATVVHARRDGYGRRRCAPLSPESWNG